MTALPPMPTTVQVKSCCGLMLNEPCDCGTFAVSVYVVASGDEHAGHNPEAARAMLADALGYCMEHHGVTPKQVRPDRWMAPAAPAGEVWIYRMAVR